MFKKANHKSKDTAKNVHLIAKKWGGNPNKTSNKVFLQTNLSSDQFIIIFYYPWLKKNH